MPALRSLSFEENHVHSTYSDGKHAVAQILEYNLFRDRLDLTFTDHVNKETDWFPAYAEEIKTLRKRYPQFAVHIGCEVKILEDGTLNTTRRILDAAETVVGSVHHFPGIKAMSKEEMLQKEFELTRLLAGHPDVDVLGHPFSMCKRFHSLAPPREYVEEVFRLCARNGIKFEFNHQHAIGSVRDLATAEITKGHISHFSFGSDVHEDLEMIGDAAFSLAPAVTVLVTGAGAGVGQSILKALKLSRVKTRVIAADMSPLAAGLYRSDAAYVIPGAADPGYLKALENICGKERVELLLIGTDVELKLWAQHRDTFEKATGARVVVSSPEAVAIADDKWSTIEFLRSHRFPFARSALADSVDSLLKEVPFPLAVKPRRGARSIGFEVVRNEAALRILLQARKDVIIQEYLPEEDEEYTCGVFFYEGECYGVIPMKRWLRSGDTYKAVARHDAEMESYIEQVGKALGITGPCNFQLRKSGGTFKIFEINCRFSGTTGAASALGFNVTNALLQHLFFGRPLQRLPFRESYVFRYWNEVFAPIAAVESLREDGHAAEPESLLNEI